jgi:peptidoglycan/LPS O-acetylase OafA/YrhL
MTNGTHHNNYKQRLSNAITWLRFPLIFFIILLHCYSVVKIEGISSINFFSIVYLPSLWLGETGVPAFFFISGILFYTSKKSYLQKLHSRIKTLLVPYLVWNTFLLVIYLLAYSIGFPQDINGKNIGEYHLSDYLRLFWDRGSFDNGNFTPILCPLWYIRNLLIMSILSPLFYCLVKYIRELFLSVVIGWWLTTYNNAFIPQTILFFCLGAYFPLMGKNALYCFNHFKIVLITLTLIFAVADVVSHVFYPTPFNLQIHRLALLFNIPALFLLADYCSCRELTNVLLPKAAFIVFCTHYPIAIVLRKTSVMFFTNSSATVHVMLYITCVLVTTILCLCIYKMLDNYFPKVKTILSGNR